MKSLGVSIKDVLDKTEEYMFHEKTKIVNERAEDISNAINVILDEDLSLSRFNDKVILSIAMQFGALATFDERLKRQAEREGIDVITF
jgi:hypothetical protein